MSFPSHHLSDGSLLLRDTAKQVQDITTLSRDVEHANNALSPIFNKEKEQKSLNQVISSLYSGPNKGKTVDAMHTTDRLSQK
ncbi:hypothetical protein WCT65_02290 [Pectobacterium carotovorum]|nr:hypothetical protein [Pectobacterium carotovorum]MCA6969674.1 hypothetical protein [Pectobacterium carotovorum]MCH4997528.1 hypothetical protein [Pectobacterium carotovorum]